MIVTQAREPLFYRDLGVPDTVNGRFDLLVLHLWMVLRRLKPVEGGADLSPGAVRPLLRRYGRQFARNGRRRSHRPQAHAGLRRGLLRPGGGLRSRLDRRRGAAGAGAVQEYPERRGKSKTRGGLPSMPRRPSRRWPDWTMRPCRAHRGGFPRRREWAHSNEQNEQHDRTRPIPGAFPSSWRKSRTPDCIATSRPTPPRAQAMAEVAGLREILSAQRFARCDARKAAAASMSRAASGRGSGRPAW